MFADVPMLGIGTWHMGDDPRTRPRELDALRTALDLGLRVVDTAEMYGSGAAEELVGEAIRGRRDDVLLVSKVLPSNASRSGTINALRRSLARLGTDHLDLYLIHWRGGHQLEESVAALEDALDGGLIRAWGVSNFDIADMDELRGITDRCATDQILYNLTRRGPEFDLLPELRALEIPVMAYSPIEQGRLFGGRRGAALRTIAADHGVNASALALAWTMRHGDTVAIPQSSNPDHVRQNVAALDIEITPELNAELDRVFPPPARSTPLEMI